MCNNSLLTSRLVGKLTSKLDVYSHKRDEHGSFHEVN